jgi:hypothetical protein
MADSASARIGPRLLLTALAAVLASPAFAQPYGYGPTPYSPPYAYRPAPVHPRAQTYGYQTYGASAACCVAPQGTQVAVQLVDAVGTQDAKAGDAIRIRLAAPVIVDGQVVLAAGTPGSGRVVQASGPGLGGKGAKLVVSADALYVGGQTVPLGGMQLTGAGKDRSLAADLASLGGWFSPPLGIVGFAVTGGGIEIPAGANAAAKIARTVSLRPLGAATRQDYDQARAVFGQPQQSRGWIQVPPPPRGLGQVVFFRARSLGGVGQWFRVRENGQALGKLSNGAYFVVVLAPGRHRFSATSEPEFKDHLTLKIDPGETYYVEGVMTHGVVIGVADLTPSDKARFDAVSGDLQAATPPSGARLAGQSGSDLF